MVIFKQFDNTEVLRIEDNASLQIGGTGGLNIAPNSNIPIIKPMTAYKDIIFQQQNGVEVARIVDGNPYSTIVNDASGSTKGGFTYKMPVMKIRNSGSYDPSGHPSSVAGVRKVRLLQEHSGYLIKVSANATADDVEIILPASGSTQQLDGIHYKIVMDQAIHADADVYIRQSAPRAVNAWYGNILIISGSVGGTYAHYVTGKKIKLTGNTLGGGVLNLTCLDGGTYNGGYETWLVEGQVGSETLTFETDTAGTT